TERPMRIPRNFEVRLAGDQLDIAGRGSVSNTQARARVQHYPGAIVERQHPRLADARLGNIPRRRSREQHRPQPEGYISDDTRRDSEGAGFAEYHAAQVLYPRPRPLP